MAFEDKNILHRLYIIAGCLFLFVLAILVKITNIQFVEGEKYKELAKVNTTKNFVIPSNRGNVYADDGSLLAISVPKYDIRFDAVTVSAENFEKNIIPLSQALSKKFNKTVAHYESLLRNARATKNRYLLLERKISYSDYLEVKKFPLFNLGPYKGGMITEQSTVREHPIGKIAERMVGYERKDADGHYVRVGLEGAYGEYLRGRDGRRLKQRIAKGQWKPIYDENEIEPRDGYDVISTININIQDIAHHALLRQLELYEAEHGTVIVMETKTGEIKAVSNLGRTKQGTYYEKLNYAIGESHEPGSTFKVMAFMAALEDKVIDTSTVVDTGNGTHYFYGKKVSDSRKGGYGKISMGRVMEVSSNIGIAKAIEENYKDKPARFVEILQRMNLDKQLDLPIIGEGKPKIPHPSDKSGWSKNALPSMSYGYGVSLTPLQTLTFYNAIANDGVMVKPRFIRQVKAWNKEIETFGVEVINPQIASLQTIQKVQDVLKNVVEKGTGRSLYSPDFSMAGKTGTAQTEYWMKDFASNRRYISSFAGYFPAENPKYSCIVIIHKPKVSTGYYGADVAGPVFKSIAQKIYIDSPTSDVIENLEVLQASIENDFQEYYELAQKNYAAIPNVKGMSGMDAVSLLENLGLKVKVSGNGKVKAQSLPEGEKLIKGKQITLELSS
ncbi:penicillin-binding protein [Planktosalinus lacus]|uniref:Penicillin-binding protein n=1 Tax=Planktosalinus lacus TaxID=1526573 RepID=A0A8J2V9C8_9FLAO|nr:penicillin-binding protein [Planktosalinus lacus]GGD89353.1 penicillin-binding protein [Planktosalinus lacus]